MANAPSGISKRRAAAKDESNPAYLQRRREIVQAAARVFKIHGLQGTNLGHIAAEAGADRASLYYYAESKEELFHEVVREAVEENLRRAEAIQEGPGTAVDKIRQLITSLMQSYAANYPILYVFIQENLTHMPAAYEHWANDMRRINKNYEQVIVALVQTGFDEGTIQPVAPAWIVAFGIMGMLGWTNRWFNPEDSPTDAAEIAAAFADTVLLGLQRPPVKPRGRPGRGAGRPDHGPRDR